MTSGTGSEIVRVDVTDELYIVNWDTDRCVTGPCTLSPDAIYRIQVLVTGAELGHADVQVVTSQQQAKDANTGASFSLSNGRTLPVKFRVEVGAVFVVSPSGGTQTVQTTPNAAGSSVTLTIPPNAITQPTGLTIQPAALPPGTTTTALVGGTAYDIGPTGTSFASPITVTIHYDPAHIPTGMAERMLRLFTLENGVWQLVAGGQVNTSAHIVTGLAGHFSTYGVLASASVTAGGVFSCGIGTSGTTVCWGSNDFGQLGDGTTTPSATPVQVVTSGGLVFSAVSAGIAHACGITTPGAAYCWGMGVFGALGNGTTANRTSPVAVIGGLSFAALTLGHTDSGSTCGVVTGGTAYCWGSNVVGQLGDGTTTDRASPTPVLGGLTFDSVSDGGEHSCGITTAGAAYCWGYNGFGQLGDGTTARGTSPMAVSGGLTFTNVSAGGAHTCGVTTTGAAYCWGYNADGQLGNGTTIDQTTPVAVAGWLTFTSVSAGFAHTCGVTSTGAAYCWGGNTHGQVGDGTTTDQTSPVLVLGGLTFSMVSAGSFHTCGIANATAYCWGLNDSGQLGDGTTTDSPTPAQVTTLP